MRVRCASVALVLLLAGCGATEGPLLIALDGGAVVSDGGGAIDGGASSATALIGQDDPWQYQLVGTVNTDLDVELFVVDLFNFDESDIARLHAQDKLVVAYLSAGTRESYRDDAGRFPAAAIGRPLESYPNEMWLDVRDATVRTLMAARLDTARNKGFDGVFPTSLSGYQHDNGFGLTAADQAEYTIWLAEQARARGLRVGMGDDFARAEELGGHFDFAIHYGCIARGNCALLDPFRAQGKTVLDIETQGTRDEVCRLAAQYQVNAIIKQPGFGASLMGCP